MAVYSLAVGTPSVQNIRDGAVLCVRARAAPRRAAPRRPAREAGR
jgi:hypothetical protein